MVDLEYTHTTRCPTCGRDVAAGTEHRCEPERDKLLQPGPLPPGVRRIHCRDCVHVPVCILQCGTRPDDPACVTHRWRRLPR